MPIRVQLPDGNVGEFPDSMSNEQIEAVLQKQFPKTQSETSGPEARTFGNYASEVARGVGRGVVNDVKGLSSLLHPINTAKEIATQTVDAAKAAGKEFSDTKGAPITQRATAAALSGLEQAPVIGGMVQHAEQGGERMASPEAAGAAAEGITTFAAPEEVARGVGALVRSAPEVARAATRTGSKPVGELVKDVTEENAKSAADAAKKNEAQEAKRKVDLRKHFEKTQDVKEQNTASAEAANRKEALNRGVEHLDTQFKDDLKALRDKVHEQADAKYKALNEALDDKEAHPDFLIDSVVEATDKIKGSNTEPTILKDMERKIKSGDALTYRDLQGYYSELGRELTKGTLPGDVYAAFDSLQDAVGGEMQRIADANGLGPQLADARATWRQMKQTFYDPRSPAYKALKAPERGGAIKAFQGKDQTGIEAIAKYSPDLARRANTIRGYQAEAKTIRPGKINSLPNLSEKPNPVTPEVRKINAEDIRNAKAESLGKRSEQIRKRGAQIVTTLGAYRALADAFHGNFGAIPTLLGESGLGIASTYGLSRLLERPEIVKFLTEPTAKDISSIPPELRGDIAQVAQQAQKQGIKVSPALLSAVGASGANRKRVAAALKP